jgi:hypothetical protein
MKKLLEISESSQCLHRVVAFTSRHPLTGERDSYSHFQIEGYSCGHPKCNEKYLEKLNKDFLPCNTKKGFPRCCPLIDVLILKCI